MRQIVLRRDASDKARGLTKYTDDLQVADYLYGMPVGIPASHGLLKKINFDPTYDWSKLTIITHADLLQMGIQPTKSSDEPIVIENEFRYFGQTAVLLAHSDREILHEAAKKISFEFQEIPAVLSLSLDDQIPDDRLFGDLIISKGQGNSKLVGNRVSRGRFQTQTQEHLYLETQSIVAKFDHQTGKLSVQGGVQAPFNVLDALSRSFGAVVQNINVIPVTIGGAFGGREDFTTQITLWASALSIKSSKTVKVVLDRLGDLKYSSKRHPSDVLVQIDANQSGKVEQIAVDFLLDGGSYETISNIVRNRAILHPGSFDSPNYWIRGRTALTHKPPNGAFRGFGSPQIFFAVESQISQTARELGIDEVEFRRLNTLNDQSLSLSGQRLTNTVSLHEIFEELLEFSEYDKRKKIIQHENQLNPAKKKGLGLACVFHGTGYTGFQDIDGPISINLRLQSDGKIQIESSVIEFGQGSWTTLPLIVAEILQIDPLLIEVLNLDTNLTPNSGATVASRSTTVLGSLVETAAFKLREGLGQYHDHQSYLDACKMLLKDKPYYSISEKYLRSGDFDYTTLQGHAYENYASAAMLTQIEVDLNTCNLIVQQIDIVMDAGRIVNQSAAQGQVQGGLIQGLGLALFEDLPISDRGYQVKGLSGYTFPTPYEIPQINIRFSPKSQFGRPKGLGEIPINGVAPSIANALADATGIRIKSLPITPEKISAAKLAIKSGELN